LPADDRSSQRRLQKVVRVDSSRLQELFGTKQPVFLSTSSAWGVMEGAIRNLVGSGKVLNLHVWSVFGQVFDVSKRCGSRRKRSRWNGGGRFAGEQIREKLERADSTRHGDHNETSTE